MGTTLDWHALKKPEYYEPQAKVGNLEKKLMLKQKNSKKNLKP